MSEKINRIIKSAEKAVKFGDFNAARMTCFEGLETYPENPRLQALAKRLAKPQIAQKHREKEQGVSLPKTIADELKELSDSYDWLSLVKRCLELKDQYKKSPVLWNFLGCAYLKRVIPF